jgi:hypothetical protein
VVHKWREIYSQTEQLLAYEELFSVELKQDLQNCISTTRLYTCVREWYTANECSELFSSYQPCQYGMNLQHFGDYFCLYDQELI